MGDQTAGVGLPVWWTLARLAGAVLAWWKPVRLAAREQQAEEQEKIKRQKQQQQRQQFHGGPGVPRDSEAAGGVRRSRQLSRLLGGCQLPHHERPLVAGLPSGWLWSQGQPGVRVCV